MKGILIFDGKILTLALIALVGLLTTACFTIILEEQQPAEQPADEAEPVETLPGELNLHADSQLSDQDVNNLDAPELVSATDIFVPTVIPSPTFTMMPEPSPAYRLSVNGVPATGSMLVLDNGTVEVSSPPQEAVGLYLGGDQIQLTAAPADGYQFDGWEGACVGDDDECRVVMNEDQSVTAKFVANFYKLIINQVLVSGSSVSVDHGLIAVSPVADAANQGYAVGVIVSLTAIPDTGFVLADWGGVCSELGPDTPECTLTMDGDRLVDVMLVEETAEGVAVDAEGVAVDKES